ncbi:terpene synthase family protein [Streptomyces sp. NPDC001933]|uniref:terpene synthase family protein n=1 Tax=Streptomyces sp. NPDC001933 TaxID=3364626 RepID=UPI0036828199
MALLSLVNNLVGSTDEVRAPEAWRKRIRHDHTVIFIAYLDHRIRRTMPTADQYLQRRRITTGLPLALAVAERVERWRAPEWFLDTPHARALLEEATKLAILPNDVFAVEREEIRGEVDNMVLVLEAAGRTRDEAIADIQAMVRHASERFLQLTDRLPAHYDDLGLSPADRASANTYVQAMRHILRGTFDWMADGTTRYDRQATFLAVSSGYEDAPATTHK